MVDNLCCEIVILQYSVRVYMLQNIYTKKNAYTVSEYFLNLDSCRFSFYMMWKGYGSCCYPGLTRPSRWYQYHCFMKTENSMFFKGSTFSFKLHIIYIPGCLASIVLQLLSCVLCCINFLFYEIFSCQKKISQVYHQSEPKLKHQKEREM